MKHITIDYEHDEEIGFAIDIIIGNLIITVSERLRFDFRDLPKSIDFLFFTIGEY